MKKRTKEYRLLEVVGIGLIYAVFTYAACALLFSPFAYMLPSPGGYLGVFSMLSLLLSGLITGVLIARKKRETRAIAALLCSLAVVVLLLGISLALKGGVSGAVIINCVIFTASALVFSSISRGKGARRSRRVRRA